MIQSFETIEMDSTAIATLIPISPHFKLQEGRIHEEKKYVLSRFAYVHRENDQAILECPLSHAKIRLDHLLAAAAVYNLVRPVSLNEICISLPTLSRACARELITLLLNSSMVWEVNDDGKSPEDEVTQLRCWEFHDLLFHSRSRGGRHDNPAGGTVRFAEQFKPPSILKEMKGPVFDLYRPNLEKMQMEDLPYARVQEERSSIRKYSEKAISDQQLGEFLYRVGRIADYWKVAIDTPGGTYEMDAAPRPYPAAGGLYELELYVAVKRCENLESGFYYYDPQNHRLIEISRQTEAVEQLLQGASRSSGIASEQLQVLITISARFQRISWKYSAMAYAAILKDLGVLYQTMYLAATAMSLAPCALGYGDSDLFAALAGTEYYTETSVGEFLLGTPQNK